MKVVIHTMIWGRFEVFKFWAESVKELKDRFPSVEIDVVVAGSEGKKSKNIVERYGFKYVKTPNSPLGRKANLALLACKKLKPDYVLFLGSDDIVSPKTFEFLLKKMRKGYDEICNMDLYLYDIKSGLTVYFHGYTNHRDGEPMGVGRCLSAEFLDQTKWSLWDKQINKYLDGSSNSNLKKISHSRFIYRLKEKGLMIFDIKSSTFITPFTTELRCERVPFSKISKQVENAYKLLML
ncbi:MAG: glycosyltransferase family A protein [Candidatus Anammoxibacter sp.]